MNENAINWDSIPDVITKDQLYRICHIIKSTARYRFPKLFWNICERIIQNCLLIIPMC